MSWRIQTLLLNHNQIHESHNLESDDYNDLLVLEKKIKDLYLSKEISDKELNLIKAILVSSSYSGAGKLLGTSRFTVSKRYTRLCNKIANIIGGDFLDSLYLNDLKSRYELSDDNVEKLKKYMGSKFKHKTLRKTND